MSRATDQNYLRGEQYQDAANLNARIALHQRFGTANIGWHPWVFEQLDLPPMPAFWSWAAGRGCSGARI